MKEMTKLKYTIAFRKMAWVLYGGAFLWLNFEYGDSVTPFVHAVVLIIALFVILIAEATLVEWDLAIEMKKEELKAEKSEVLDWL